MAVEVATLQFKADTSDLGRAAAALRKVGAAANDAEHELDGLEKEAKSANKETEKAAKGGFGKAAVALAAIATAALTARAALKKTVDVTREFEVINASLVTVTGSAEKAQRQFQEIQKFAATTPYDLAQVANAFTQLAVRGLDPSMEALTAYGDVASGLGRNLEDMVRAIGQASVGEFEALKSFGIQIRKDGQELIVLYKGMETRITNSATAIEQHIQKIAAEDFMGNMERRSATLDGAISNLGDSWDALFLTIGTGTKGPMNEFIRLATQGVEDLSAAIALAQGTADSETRLLAVNKEITLLKQRKKAIEDSGAAGRRSGQEIAEIEEEINSLLLQRQNIENEIYTETYWRREQEAADEAERLRIQAEQAAAAQAKRRELEQDSVNEILRLNETEDEEIRRIHKERLDYIKALETSGDYAPEEIHALKIAAEEKFNAEMKALADERAQDQIEAVEKALDAMFELEEQQQNVIRENYEKRLEAAEQMVDAMLEEEQRLADEQTRIKEEQKDILLNFEDLLLEGKSEKTKAAVRLAANLADAEKRENAASIISNSYDAAMKAYSALAGIPIIGPALGAAAAATVLAAGVTYAAQSMQGRALGGQVRAGESYVVGERGPEVLTMGNMSGNITPNTALTKGGSQTTNNNNVTINVAAPDGKLDKRSIQQMQQGVYRSMSRANARNR